MSEKSTQRCAVIFNPTKVADGFEDRVDALLTEQGWKATWLSTSKDDPGRAMTEQAVAEGVDLVIAAGGDGTVRIVADGLSETGIALAIVPAGTGNLLARNVGIPLAEEKALDVALTGRTRTLDLIAITADDQPPTSSAVMAGMGVDAVIMDETDDDLKARIGPAAYVLAAAKALGRLPMDVTVTVDGRRPRRRRAMICAVGNVGQLMGNISLIPGAEPDDGMLDIYIASPHRATHWFRILGRLITRRGHRDDRVDQWRARRVTFALKERDSYELDGDVEGQCRTLTAEIKPGALLLRVPADT